MTENKINRIVDMEWRFFDKVNNVGGRAGCQDDFDTFYANRSSQFLAWSKSAVDSYYRDLEDCEARGVNPVECKYAYMMYKTDPERYERIRDLLPEVSLEKRELVEELVCQGISWEQSLRRSYPALAGLGRPLRTAPTGTAEFFASVETYMRCEFFTYSMRTLELLKDYFQKLEDEGKNYAMMVLENEVHYYGYRDLDEAEQEHKSRF